MGVSFQRAGRVTSAKERRRNESPGIDIGPSPPRATKIKETSAAGMTAGFANAVRIRFLAACVPASIGDGLPVFRNDVVADITAENPDRGFGRERWKVAQMRHLCLAFVAAAARDGFVSGCHKHGRVSILMGVEGGHDSIMRQCRPRLVVNTAHPGSSTVAPTREARR
jgi:hypothetical protein